MFDQLKYQQFKIFAHVTFWAISFVLLSLLFHFYGENYSISLFLKSFTINLLFSIAVYLNLYFLIPRFLKKKNYIFYFFWLVTFLTIISLLLQLLFIYPLKGIISLNSSASHFNSNLHSAYFFSILVYVVVTTFVKFVKDWISLQDLNLKLVKIEQQKLEAELKTLKGQLNPHFLFNSLNNIYSLALVKSEKVPELILKLADLMRHIIYESKENFISLEKELEFVQNFIELQRIRTSEKTIIKYTIKGEIPSAKIAPLLFEPFIDNAFKHGLPGSAKNDFIEINFDFSIENKLNFTISNNYNEFFISNKKNSGIGLQNVKQRLKLLYQPHEFDLQIDKSEQVFRASLDLILK